MEMPTTTLMAATMTSQGPTPNMTMGVDQMAMVFLNSLTTPLFFNAWTPSGPVAYAAICIFILVLGVVHRVLVAFRNIVFEGMPAAGGGAAARVGEMVDLLPLPAAEDDETACLGPNGAASEGPQGIPVLDPSWCHGPQKVSSGIARAFHELTIGLASYLL